MYTRIARSMRTKYYNNILSRIVMRVLFRRIHNQSPAVWYLTSVHTANDIIILLKKINDRVFRSVIVAILKIKKKKYKKRSRYNQARTRGRLSNNVTFVYGICARQRCIIIIYSYWII